MPLQPPPRQKRLATRSQLAKTFARYRGHLGPSGPKLQIEFGNGFPGPFGPGPPKSPRQSRKRVKIVEKLSILTLFRLRFALFGPRGREGPGTHFEVHLQLSARKAQMTPVAGPGIPESQVRMSMLIFQNKILER